MKIPKKEKISVKSAKLNDIPMPYTEAWTYNHDDRLFGEIAGHIFNKYLHVKREKDTFGMGTRFRFSFSSSHPKKAGIFLDHFMSDSDLLKNSSSTKIVEYIYENAVEEFINKSLNAVDTVHQLEHSFTKRLKYLFTKKF